MAVRPSWTTPADVEAKVRRVWDSGALLRAHALGAEFPVIDLPLRGPTPGEIGDDLERVQRWKSGLEERAHFRSQQRYTLTSKSVGGRVVGRNLLPARATVSTYGEAWALLGVRAEVAAYDAVLAVTAEHEAAHAWAMEHPLKALRVADEWPGLIAAAQWLAGNGGRGLYLREISAPGVDTKFVERHRGLLAELVEAEPRPERFATSLGFRDKPATLRLRFDPGFLGLPEHFSEATFRLDELAAAGVSVRSAIIVENEITYLSVPVPAEGVVIFGEGFRVSRAGSLPWLRGVPVRYWGDLDTHGFAILHQLRAWLPQVESLLMDSETLLAHRDRWVREPTPRAATLDKLTGDEQSVYGDLLSDRHAGSVRLEQERIDWDWVLTRWPDE